MKDSQEVPPCAHCREPANACGCAAAMCCTDCGEFWQCCSCHSPSDDESERHVD